MQEASLLDSGLMMRIFSLNEKHKTAIFGTMNIELRIMQ